MHSTGWISIRCESWHYDRPQFSRRRSHFFLPQEKWLLGVCAMAMALGQPSGPVSIQIAYFKPQTTMTPIPQPVSYCMWVNVSMGLCVYRSVSYWQKSWKLPTGIMNKSLEWWLDDQTTTGCPCVLEKRMSLLIPPTISSVTWLPWVQVISNRFFLHPVPNARADGRHSWFILLPSYRNVE